MLRTLIAAGATLAASFMIPDAAEACPDWQYAGRANLGTLSGSYLYTPRYWNVVAGGNVDLGRCNAPGVGYVVSDPDFEFSFQNDRGYGRLEISVNGNCDTVLLVNDANGTWHFNDDANGSLNPVVNVYGAPSGTYDVWVGTYGPNTCNAQIELETWN
ncbi:MAG: hypothetical protein AAF689_05585 [Pseudomonadota bacterium]